MDIQRRINRLISNDLKRCQNLYERMSGDLSNLETGSVTLRNGVFNWFQRVDGKQYSKKIEDAALLFRLRKRQFVKRALPLLAQRIKNNKRYLNDDVLYDPVKINMEIPEQYKGLRGMDIFLDNDINVEDWDTQNYSKNELYNEGRRYKINENDWVRSKSETIIAMRLQEKGFHIKYELKLDFGKQIFYPDFAILLPVSRRLVYYEHFGMIDDPEYAKKAFKKLKTYAENGIMLGYNLVITFETRDDPLSLENVDDVINQLYQMDK